MITNTSKILLVDDLDLTRRMIRNVLDEMGYESIHDAKDGTQAMERLREAVAQGSPFQVVFLDWNMPKMSGLEVLQSCRQDPALKDLTIIMVTAEAEKKNVLQALTAGATDYIVKPCSADILKATIEHINQRFMKKAGNL